MERTITQQPGYNSRSILKRNKIPQPNDYCSQNEFSSQADLRSKKQHALSILKQKRLTKIAQTEIATSSQCQSSSIAQKHIQSYQTDSAEEKICDSASQKPSLSPEQFWRKIENYERLSRVNGMR